MKKQFSICRLTTDKALLFAQKFNILKDRLSQINANLEEYNISYDDSVTNESDIKEILEQVFNLK